MAQNVAVVLSLSLAVVGGVIAHCVFVGCSPPAGQHGP
jgi:hypothetical protein